MDRIDQLAARLETLETENRSLRDQVEAMGSGGAAALPEPTSKIDRRSAMRNLAGAAAGAVGLFAASSAIAPEQAGAANGDPVVLGQDNDATYRTRIVGTDVTAEAGPPQVLDVTSISGDATAIRARGSFGHPSIVIRPNGTPSANGVSGGLQTFAEEGVDTDSHLYYYHAGTSESTTRVGRVHTSYFSNFLQLDTPKIVMRSNRTESSLNPTGGNRSNGQRLAGGVVYTLDLSSHVDADASGVILNVTDFDQSEDDMFATIWDGTGNPPPVKTVSSQAGVIATNLAISALSSSQSIGIFVKSGTEMHMRLELMGQIRSGQGEGGVL